MNSDFWISLLEFALAIIVMIILHEFGHFLAARSLKVEVEEFGLGIPPRALVLFKAWGTKFSLNWIPLGGFVRPKGENDPSVPGGLAAARPWVRLSVYVAGPLMNLLLGVVLSSVIFYRTGLPDYTQVNLMGVVANSPAAQAGLQPGDIILKVNNVVIDSTDKLHDIIYANLERSVEIVYKRGEGIYTVSLVPRSNPPDNEGAIGILMGNPTVKASWPRALGAGGEAVYQYSRALLELPVQLLKGNLSPQERPQLLGFKGMFTTYQEARQGELAPGVPPDIGILSFFTSITISLGLLNLLPFPALDGGRILFVLPELIFRRRVPPEFENLVNLVGFAILILLMLYINLHEFI
jgi:regulator of sigma E protease